MSDIINALFEFFGACLLMTNVFRLYRDKKLQGVNITPTAFFFLWGWWNIYYYPSLGQWWSFAGGIAVVVANGLWVGLAIYYRRKK